VATEIFFAWLAVVAIMVVIATAVVDRRHLQWLAAAFVLGVVISAAIGAAQAQDGRLVGASGDPNFLAAGIVPAIVLAFALASNGRRVVGRFAALTAVGVLVAGLVATQSRGGLVAAGVAAVAAFVLADRARGAIFLALLMTVATAAAWFSWNPVAWQRMSDFGESSGRGELWHVGWRMWQDHPVTGVGLGGFRDHSRDYVFELGLLRYAEYFVEQPKLVHNVYLELLTETGLVGLLLFSLSSPRSVQCAWRAAGRFGETGDRQMETWLEQRSWPCSASSRVVLLSNTTDRRTWILLAMGPALLAASRRCPVGLATGGVRSVGWLTHPGSADAGGKPQATLGSTVSASGAGR
jgi:O-antigen ligase